MAAQLLHLYKTRKGGSDQYGPNFLFFFFGPAHMVPALPAAAAAAAPAPNYFF